MILAFLNMSLEKALDDERRDVIDILEGRSKQSPDSASTPTGISHPPVRSMLDVGNTSALHVPAVELQGNRPEPSSAIAPSNPAVRSMSNASPPASSHTMRKQTTSKTFHMPGFSSPRPVEPDRDKGIVDSSTDYDSNMEPNVQGPTSPGRMFQNGKKQLSMRSMAAIMQGRQLSQLPGGGSRGRHNSTAGIIGGKSKSPSSRLSNGPESPEGAFVQTAGKSMPEGGKVIDMRTARRRLSDATTVRSTGERDRLDDNEMLSSDGELRMQKDNYPDEETGEAVETSDEERYGESSADEALGSKNNRGRRRGRKGSAEEDLNTEGSEADNIDIKKGPLASKYKNKSSLEPTLTITSPGGERLSYKRSGVHPHTNYDQSASRNASPTTSDSDELNDIRRAQRMQIRSSPVDSSIPHRMIRTIIRGDFAKMQEEAEEGSRRLRTYLVATDLSGEAAYALEWTIGTVLRDGDTLLAVYAVDEEIGTGKTGDPDGLPIGEGAKAMQDTTALVEKMTAAAQSVSPSSAPSPLSNPALLPGSSKGSGAGSTDSRYMSKAEQERLHAIEGISQTCIKFLRKTKLQVRIAVEVIHCKSPKYMITEAVSPPFPFPSPPFPPLSTPLTSLPSPFKPQLITSQIDGLNPTLVILGSRGRSALKGVLLGSFSNYLVTKSSVPVMVARKRLSGRKTKKGVPNVRLANNLTPIRLSEAKID